MNKNQIQDRNYHGKDIEKTKTIPNQYPHGIARVQDFEPLVRYERWPQGPNGNGFKIMSFRTKREIYFVGDKISPEGRDDSIQPSGTYGQGRRSQLPCNPNIEAGTAVATDPLMCRSIPVCAPGVVHIFPTIGLQVPGTGRH
jgi:hypothetical protein